MLTFRLRGVVAFSGRVSLLAPMVPGSAPVGLLDVSKRMKPDSRYALRLVQVRPLTVLRSIPSVRVTARVAVPPVPVCTDANAVDTVYVKVVVVAAPVTVNVPLSLYR